MDIVKPAGWVFGANGPQARAPQARGAGRGAGRAARRHERRYWSTTYTESGDILCDECETAMDKYVQALYHLSGMDPLCDDCINADAEWQGLKWEPKYYWR